MLMSALMLLSAVVLASSLPSSLASPLKFFKQMANSVTRWFEPEIATGVQKTATASKKVAARGLISHVLQYIATSGHTDGEIADWALAIVFVEKMCRIATCNMTYFIKTIKVAN